MQIVNQPTEDYHVHSLNFSDGTETIDGMVRYAGEIGLTKLAIVDHCQATLDYHHLARKNLRDVLKRWKNVHNEVQVIFGVEADLLNENGDICDQIQGMTSDWLILSAHKVTYSGNPARVTEGYIKAMERFGLRIKVIGHPCSGRDFAGAVDIKKLTAAANERKIPLEVNGKNLKYGITDLEQLALMLRVADKVMVNSDAHTNYELLQGRKWAWDYIKEQK